MVCLHHNFRIPSSLTRIVLKVMVNDVLGKVYFTAVQTYEFYCGTSESG